MPQLNPLNHYRSFNYRWRFGCVPPGSLDSTSFSNINIIAASSGHTKTRVTQSEAEIGTNVEFFIESVEFDSLVAANPGTNNTNAISFRFEVVEPYSVGLFFQTLEIAAAASGYSNYIEAPFFLALNFIGHTDSETVESTRDYLYILKLTNLRFTADKMGSTYQIEAIPFNHLALLDEIQEMPTTINAKGDTVKQTLDTLVDELNAVEQGLVDQNIKNTGNRFIINFPQDIATFGGSHDWTGDPAGIEPQREIQTSGPIPGVTNSQGGPVFLDDVLPRDNVIRILDADIGQGSGSGSEESALDQIARETQGRNNTFIPGIGWGIENRNTGNLRVDNGFAVTSTLDPNSNYLGNSLISSDFNQFGNTEFQSESEVWSVQKGIFEDANVGIDPNSRFFTFNQGVKIEKIIESVLLSSEWGKGLADSYWSQPDSNNMIQWYKIDTQVKILDVGEMQKTGRPAMEFIFNVVPKKMHYSIISKPGSLSNYDSNLANVDRVYNYVYTGMNTDIIDFEFTIDNAFFRGFVDTQSGVDRQTSNAFTEFSPSVGPGIVGNVGTDPSGITPFTAQSRLEHNTPGAGGTGTNSEIVARLFNNIILNSDVDNIALELKIWGDPYYLFDTGTGNYRNPRGSSYADSQGTADFNRTEVDVLIRFNSAVDIKAPLYRKDPYNAFNGLYKVIAFSSSFEGGMFTQTLSLLRRPGQSIETVETATTIVDAFAKENGVDIISNALAELGETVGLQTLPFIASIPKEFEAFTRLTSIGVENFTDIAPQLITQAFGGGGIITRALAGTPIGEAISGVTSIVNQGLQLRNNLVATLSEVQDLPNQLDNIVNQATTVLQDPATYLSQIAENELNASVERILGPELRTQIKNVETQLAPIANLGNLGNQIVSDIQAIGNPVSQFFKGIS